MNRHLTLPAAGAACVLVLVTTQPPGASAETVFHCIDARGATTFSDLPCAPGSASEADRLAVVLHNAVSGMALGDADRDHLEAIDARAPSGPGFAGLPDPARDARCSEARAEREALRTRARRGHTGSLREARRAANARVRTACH